MKNKFTVVTVIIFLLVVSFQYGIMLREQHKLPSDEWSRTLPIEGFQDTYSRLTTVPVNEGYFLTLHTFDKVDFAKCTVDMECVKEGSINDLNAYKNVWADGTDTYFIRDSTLIYRDSANKEDVISKDVLDFSKTKETLAYWLNDQHTLHVESKSLSHTYTIEGDIFDVNLDNDDLFVVTKDIYKNTMGISLVQQNEVKELFSFRINAGDMIQSVSIFPKNATDYTLMVGSAKNSGGATVQSVRTLTFNLTEPSTPTLTLVKLVDVQTGREVDFPRYPTVHDVKGQKKFLFTADTYLEDGSEANTVFIADFNPEEMTATPISKPGELYSRPSMVDDTTVLYFEKKYSENTLVYASSDQQVRQSTVNGIPGDYLEAFFSMGFYIFKGLVLVLLSFLWILPAYAVSYGVMLLLQKRQEGVSMHFTYASHIVMLVVVQVILFVTLFNSDRIVARIPYLTEDWQLSLILLLTGILSISPMLITRKKVTEDNLMRMVLHVTLLNLAILMVIVGSYFV
ncbi:hypothetical protein [Paenisporosarcina cavernae]|uniref:Uncharacterized protein n=1 Tax=Paenisporosarcina cavernae TaxID=2320858 RepID=A0A385YQN4_9BACL|nr:hypothetical protein [Paenisporosarcina cavernae]AYC28804.1 hypothetical protein D3873_02555 [Paenisporosarcina cavernae]